jgi:hypothetical protein
MDEAHVTKYDYWLDRRKHWQAEEAANIESLIEAQGDRQCLTSNDRKFDFLSFILQVRVLPGVFQVEFSPAS